VGDVMENRKQPKSKSPKQQAKKEEKLSTKDLEELMGVNRDIYTRHNGAIRRK
jgi:hypothetical protein